MLISHKASLRPGSLLGIKGKNHPRWKGGYARDKNYKSNKDYEWKNAVKKRCNYMCIVTGQKEKLVSHHIDS